MACLLCAGCFIGSHLTPPLSDQQGGDHLSCWHFICRLRYDPAASRSSDEMIHGVYTRNKGSAIGRKAPQGMRRSAPFRYEKLVLYEINFVSSRSGQVLVGQLHILLSNFEESRLLFPLRKCIVFPSMISLASLLSFRLNSVSCQCLYPLSLPNAPQWPLNCCAMR